MAHSYVLAIGSDIEAFQTYARSFPSSSIFLIDTHDVIEGARSAVKVALNMAKEGHSLKGVRIDRGEMVYKLARYDNRNVEKNSPWKMAGAFKRPLPCRKYGKKFNPVFQILTTDISHWITRIVFRFA